MLTTIAVRQTGKNYVRYLVALGKIIIKQQEDFMDRKPIYDFVPVGIDKEKFIKFANNHGLKCESFSGTTISLQRA